MVEPISSFDLWIWVELTFLFFFFAAIFQTHLISGQFVARLIQLATCPQMHISEYAMGILAFLSENGKAFHRYFSFSVLLLNSFSSFLLSPFSFLFFSFTEASHEQLLACENLAEFFKPIVLNTSKYTKKMSQNALRVLVLLHLDGSLSLEDNRKLLPPF